MGVRAGGATAVAASAALWLSGCGDSALGGSPTCRTYAAAYTDHVSYPDIRSSVTCTHAETNGFERTCLGGTDTVERWTSRSDFIAEAAAVGVIRVTAHVFPTSGVTLAYEYDAQRRLQRITSSQGYVVEEFGAWDELGRPTRRLQNQAICPGADITISYGDRTVTSAVPAGDPCNATRVETFDADGIPTTVDDGNGMMLEDFTTTSRVTVCL